MYTYELNYNCGRGHMTIDLDAFLPAVQQKLKVLIATIDKTDDPDADAVRLHNYIADRVSDLLNERLNTASKARAKQLTDQIAAYCRNSAAISKRFGMPPVTDPGAEQVKMRKATVYSMGTDNGRTVIRTFDGWTFDKGGYTFDLYRREPKPGYEWNVLLRGTGLAVAHVTSKNAAAEAITENVLEALRRADLAAKYEVFDRLMREQFPETTPQDHSEPETTDQEPQDAEPTPVTDQEPEPAAEPTTETTETTDQEPAPEPEKTEDTQCIYTPTTVTVNGTAYPATYRINDLGYVGVHYGAEGYWMWQVHPDYPAALAAAKAALAMQEPEPEPEPEPESERDPKAARGPVPEKTFIGTTIEGRGWRIYFDGAAERTRIILDDDAAPAVRAAVEDAGFYYSPKMRSYNKKLTFKAYRAAKALAEQLNAA